MSLADLLVGVAAGLPDVNSTSGGDGSTTWAYDGRTFAVLTADGAGAEFALDPPVAAAAARTPDASPSPRGPGWVLFRPAVLDEHAADRATAWFGSAHRRLAQD